VTLDFGPKARLVVLCERPPNHAFEQTARKRRLRVPSRLRGSAAA
jgi:hypothetical protein